MALFKPRSAAGCSGSCPAGCWLEQSGGSCTCYCPDARVQGRLRGLGAPSTGKVILGTVFLLAAAGAGKVIADVIRGR